MRSQVRSSRIRRRDVSEFESMKVYTDSFTMDTRGKGTYEISDQLAGIVELSEVENGVATVFVCHTSCS